MSYGAEGDPRRFDSLEEMMETHWREKPWHYKLKAVAIRRPINRVRSKYHSVRGYFASMYQFHKRGWANYQAWSFSGVSVRAMGEQLIYLSDIAHGWPGEEWGTFEEWTAQLREAGEALVSFSRTDEIEWSVEKKDECFAEYERRHESAKNALAWVGENLPSIWD